jgi:dihydrofolate reductase
MPIAVAHIVALNRQRVIGVENRLPWHLPADLKHFKALTMGKPIIMGRKTWESIGRPLPGRENIVVTRQEGYGATGAKVCASLEDALHVARESAERDGLDEIFVIGGETLYRQSLSSVDRVYVTEVAAEVDGDAFYPELDEQDWSEVSRQNFAAEEGAPAYAFVNYQRRAL